MNNEWFQMQKFFEILSDKGDAKKEYLCPFPGCNEKFGRKNNLTNHFKSHVNSISLIIKFIRVIHLDVVKSSVVKII